MASQGSPMSPAAAPDDALPQAGGEESTARHSVHSLADYCIYHAPKAPGAAGPGTPCALTARFSVKLETKANYVFFQQQAPVGQ